MKPVRLKLSPFSCLFLIPFLLFLSCSKEKGCMDPDAVNYDPDAEREDGSCEYQGEEGTAPGTYDFSDADLSKGRTRIELLDRLVKKLQNGENGASIALQDLYDIHRNNGITGDPSHDLEGLLRTQDSLVYDGLLQTAASRSGDPSAVIDGRFVTSDSIDIVMMARYGLMQAAFFRYSTEELLEGMGQLEHDDPEGTSPTEREKAYDEAFSLFGAPRDYSRTTSFGSGTNYGQGAWFWATSCLRTDSAVGQLPALFDAFVKGRWALTQEKAAEREEAVQVVERLWERTAGALMIRHIKRCMAAIDAGDPGERIRHWSIVHAIHLSLDANSDGIVGTGEHQELRDRIGASPRRTTTQALNEALALLQDIYGFKDRALQEL